MTRTNILITIPDLNSIMSRAISIQTAGESESWQKDQLGAQTDESGVYFFVHAESSLHHRNKATVSVGSALRGSELRATPRSNEVS